MERDLNPEYVKRDDSEDEYDEVTGSADHKTTTKDTHQNCEQFVGESIVALRFYSSFHFSLAERKRSSVER